MKEKIIGQAVEIFNRKGITQATLRDIARELGISDGHLRYYFKTKEDLVLTIFSAMEREIASFAAEGSMMPFTAQSLVLALSKSYAVMYRYVFFFTESTAILETFPKVYAAYQHLIQSRRELVLTILEQFRKEGVFAESMDVSLFPVLFEQVFILSDNWVKYARLPQNAHLTEAEQIDRYVAVSVALFLPYFNTQFKDEVTEWVRKVVR
ncbi:TetR/AcrR family transcriptional regulator [Sabulibacter ruber]|uniref:TetR/AcrR family transcriptional regulator n=1 Tax=Sabulibacter ruber TaxID=2811901 RepID=UPI001A967BEB|nr:TetR/AcrR family transcriptional regulator [Sabulibacter ruber]